MAGLLMSSPKENVLLASPETELSAAAYFVFTFDKASLQFFPSPDGSLERIECLNGSPAAPIEATGFCHMALACASFHTRERRVDIR